jgi:hypothetical protein
MQEDGEQLWKCKPEFGKSSWGRTGTFYVNPRCSAWNRDLSGLRLSAMSAEGAASKGETNDGW